MFTSILNKFIHYVERDQVGYLIILISGSKFMKKEQEKSRWNEKTVFARTGFRPGSCFRGGSHASWLKNIQIHQIGSGFRPQIKDQINHAQVRQKSMGRFKDLMVVRDVKGGGDMF